MDADESNKRSRQQLSPIGTKQTTPRNELFTQVSQLLSNELHHYDPSLKQLSREVADVFLKEGVIKGMPLILTNNGQFRPMSKESPNWPWKQLVSTLDSINPNYDQEALKKFMGCTNLAMRDTLYNQHQADQMSRGRNLTEEMEIVNSFEDLPYEEFDVFQASQSRVVEEEVKKPTQSKAGGKEVEEVVEGEKDALQASPSRTEVDKEKTEAEEEAEEEKNALKAATSRAEKRPNQTKEEKKEEEAKDGKEEKKEEEAKDGKEGKKESEEEGEEESKKKKKEEEAKDGKEEKKEEEVKDGKEEKKEEEVKDGKEGKKEAEEEGEEESKMKKEKRKNTRSTNKGELITPQPAATKAIEKDEDFPAPEFHLSINATTPRKGRAPQHSILPRRERGRAPTKR